LAGLSLLARAKRHRIRRRFIGFSLHAFAPEEVVAMKPFYFTLGIAVALIGCNRQQGTSPNNPDGKAVSLTEARKGFQTRLVRRGAAKEPVPQPPPNVFRLVRYDAPAGKLAAYLSPDPKDGKKHPAIIWITGGDCNKIEDVWSEAPANNDQTASAFRKSGVVMMFPSLRGGNDNPGVKEGFLGEVDDVLAAADFLAKQEYVDPKRIYLGGHSTGGTLVMLVAECSDRFRAVFSFGPASNVRGYGPQYLPCDLNNRREIELRSPGSWLASIQSPTFVFEGTVQGNIGDLQEMARTSTNPKAQFFPVRGASHFSILAPTNRLIAAKVMLDDGPTCNLAFTAEEVSKPFGK
jgi:acetyl esterase/lipase